MSSRFIFSELSPVSLYILFPCANYISTNRIYLSGIIFLNHHMTDLVFAGWKLSKDIFLEVWYIIYYCLLTSNFTQFNNIKNEIHVPQSLTGFQSMLNTSGVPNLLHFLRFSINVNTCGVFISAEFSGKSGQGLNICNKLDSYFLTKSL